MLRVWGGERRALRRARRHISLCCSYIAPRLDAGQHHQSGSPPCVSIYPPPPPPSLRLADTPHDLMLDSNWQAAAGEVERWLEAEVVKR